MMKGEAIKFQRRIVLPLFAWVSCYLVCVSSYIVCKGGCSVLRSVPPWSSSRDTFTISSSKLFLGDFHEDIEDSKAKVSNADPVLSSQSEGGNGGVQDELSDSLEVINMMVETLKKAMKALEARYSQNELSKQPLYLKYQKQLSEDEQILNESENVTQGSAQPGKTRPTEIVTLRPTVPVVNCYCASLPTHHAFVALDESIQEAMQTIEAYAPKYSDPIIASIRVPPLVFTRLQRGGKTTFLVSLFHKLKESDYAPIFVSFGQGFERREGETSLQALIRQIGLQMVDSSIISDPLSVTFDKNTVLHHISETSNNKTVVLLIDEMNGLEFPLDKETSTFLKTNFLDAENRYLVYTSNIDMHLDYWSPNSVRGYVNAKLPICEDINELRRMSPACGALTPLEMAVYHRIPSLIYYAKSETAGPQKLFEIYFKARMVNVEDETIVHKVFKKFLSGLLSGFRIEIAENENTKGIANCVNAFAASVNRGAFLSWPICYIGVILDYFLTRLDDPFKDELNFSHMVNSDFSAYSKDPCTTGLDWELIVRLAILIRSLDAKYNGNAGPFNMLSSDAHSGTQLDRSIKSYTIPTEFNRLDTAISWIEEKLQSVDATTTIFIFTHSFSAFPMYDIILVAVTPHGIKKYGLQVKLSKAYPKSDAHPWFTKSYLVRGKAPKSTNNRSPKGWVYLDESEIKTFLGYSLYQVCPSTWPEPPEV